MIFDTLIYYMFAMLQILSDWLPKVTELPFGIDHYFVAGIGYFFTLATLFPPLATLYNGFLFIIAFKLVLKLIAFIPLLNRVLVKVGHNHTP